MKRSVVIYPTDFPPVTVAQDDEGFLAIYQTSGDKSNVIKIGGQGHCIDLFNAIRFVLGYKTK